MTFFATENHSATALGTNISFTTTPNGSVTSLERMRIDQNGNVGIGTATPASPLTVATGPGEFTPALAVLPSTHATSRGAMLLLDQWAVLQDLNGTGVKDFTIWQQGDEMEPASLYRRLATSASERRRPPTPYKLTARLPEHLPM
jgi:hypothetical protein